MRVQEAMKILRLVGTVSAEDIKLAYKRMAKEYHPDRNPAGLEVMQMINEAYATLKDESSVTAEDSDSMSSYTQEFSDAISAIVHLDGLHIEVCGMWCWVSGDTKTHKDALKEAGFKWAFKKKMWYFRPDSAKGRRFGSSSMEDIRATYGSVGVRAKAQARVCHA